MSGKGSGRRPAQISEAEQAAQWARIFGRRLDREVRTPPVRDADVSPVNPPDAPTSVR